MRFTIVTQDYAGLGFALRLKEEGHDVILATNPDPSDVSDSETCVRYSRVGDGMVEKQPLADLMERRDQLPATYWIWDQNHSVEQNELLRAEGRKVLGGGRHAQTMEHDRKACLNFAAQYGLESPPSFRFNSPPEAIAFCEANPATAYLYKPDTGQNFETFLPDSDDPEDANRELRLHLRSFAENGAPNCAFLLQERKEGVETNVEVWFQCGEPVFAFMTLECKKKYVGDLGPLTGCAFDYDFVIPLDCRAVSASVGKLFPAYREMNYTGFGDANFIAAKDGLWFLEKCERFGYNSHPNLFWNLAKTGIGEILASLVDGTFKADFAEGFGVSLTMSTREQTGGRAVQFPAKIEHDIYWYDVFRRSDLYVTAGYDHNGDVLLVNGYGYTMPTAWEAAAKKAADIRFPYRHYRTDGDQTNYPSSPIRRYEALKAMGYI
jgi:phosphoribosylamine-glycine ligase